MTASTATRPLLGVSVAAGVNALRETLAAALSGAGPAVLPLSEGQAPDWADLPVPPSVAVVIATSGSTGAPKGVMLTAKALRASAEATAERLGGPGQWLLSLPLSGVAGLQVLLRSMMAGTELVSVAAGPFTAAGFVTGTRRLQRKRRYVSLVPTQLHRILDADEAIEAARSYDAILLGGAATPAPMLARAHELGLRVVTTYGMSETCGGCVYGGVPLDGVTVKVDDKRVLLGGPTVFAGYLGEPALTAEVLHEGWLRTSDLGSWDGKRLSVHGRADDVVVSGGVNVALGAVEAVVAEHPALGEAAVTSVPDAEWGVRIVVVGVTTQDSLGLLDELKELVTARLGAAATPRALLLIPELPRLATGKTDRLAIGQLATDQITQQSPGER